MGGASTCATELIFLGYHMNLFTYSQFQTLDKTHQGVFSLNELKNYLGKPDSMSFYRELKKLEKEKIISRFSRGLYVTPSRNLEAVSQKICPDSYISFGNVLARAMLIGSIPEKKIYAVKTGKTRLYENTMGTILQLGIKKELFFGYKIKNGIAYAEPEKAYLDALYFYQKGQKFSFNIFSDIYVELLDKKKINKYLKVYKNPKFIKFVQGVLNARN